MRKVCWQELPPALMLLLGLVTAAIALPKELAPDRTVVTVACDTGLKYMNGTLLSDA